jgi:hypothetical protein
MKRNAEQSAALKAQIVRELAAKPRGLKQLAVDLGVGFRTLEKHVDALRLRGAIDYFGVRPNFKWGTKARADAENEQRKRDQAARSAEADARRERAKARRLRAEKALDAEIERGVEDWAQVVRRVPAESVKAQITGPRSVWELAA